MEIILHNNSGVPIAEIVSEGIVFRNAQDAVDILMDCRYNKDSDRIIIHQKNIDPGFFELKTALAGDILQKFSTYGSSLAIVGDFTSLESRSLKDFIYESNKGGRINFVGSVLEAITVLNK